MSPDWEDLRLLADVSCVYLKARELVEQDYEEGEIPPDKEDDHLHSMFYKLWEDECGDFGHGHTSTSLTVYQDIQEEEIASKKRKCLPEKNTKKKNGKNIDNQLQEVKSGVFRHGHTSSSLIVYEDIQEEEIPSKKRKCLREKNTKKKNGKNINNRLQEVKRKTKMLKKKESSNINYLLHGQKVEIAAPWLDSRLRELGASGTELLVLRKGVTASDTLAGHNRLLLSRKMVEDSLLNSFTETEKAVAMAEQDLEVEVFDRGGQEYKLTFTFLKSNNAFRIKGGGEHGWGKFVANHALRPVVHDLYVCAFRFEGRLRLVVVKTENEEAVKVEKEEALRAEKEEAAKAEKQEALEAQKDQVMPAECTSSQLFREGL